ncbi:MAG TPA: FecR domain-containing protein [Candidatus Ozemobacteraceae bacterium]|nr:FecR domain-containing protein [Candidatus Ozemobacteraceae bacterium]
MRPREKNLGTTVFVAVALVLLNLLFVGCGKSGKSSSAAPSVGKGESRYQVSAMEKTIVSLERSSKISELPLPPEYPLHDGDILENKGGKPASIKDLKEGHKFALAPQARVQLGGQKITMFRGKTMFEFRKMNGEFKIVLPGAVLGIRGTRFLVGVQSDGTSVVKMFEGRLEVEKDGKITPLQDQETGVIEKSSEVQVIPAGGKLPEFLNEFQDNDGSALQTF